MKPLATRSPSPSILALLLILLGACGSVPTTRYYLLAPPAATPAPAGSGLRLGVETFAVDPPYDQNRLVYRIGEASGEVGFYEHHRWAAETGRLVATALATGLRGLENLADVEPATVTGRYDLLLTGRVVSLEEVDLPGRQVSRLQLDVKLYDLEGESLLWHRLLTAEAGGEAADASDIMRQMQQAFDKLLAELRSELEAPLERAASRP